ncbi:Impact family protein [Pleurostoma richardsiae]|uniref:Impact family protein n=1 Tax=Pleurostoma richardsiae TaxID=41990 RepID=A0AA38RGH8_9PEZI|nr:Impact family protein [Pleurostoma richardsiae]
MSEELADEVEAINSIYGDGTLIALSEDSDTYILTLPGEAVSLRLQFPAAYPDEPPSIVGINSSGDHAKGVAARDLALFRDALGTVFQPGLVCLFDAIEELKRLLEEEAPPEDEPSPEEQESGDDRAHAAPQSLDDLGPEPPWVLSDPVTELKSTFIARCAPVTSPDQAERYVQHLLASDRRVRAATHNITAWRIRGPGNTSFQDCDDDGETAAGGRVLHLMQLMDLWDVVVIVTRWYGGHKLGPRRFALINAVARDAFVKSGLVIDAPSGKKKGQGR